MSAREIARQIVEPVHVERAARVLGWALRERDVGGEIVQFSPPNGHGAKYAHRDWLPALNAMHA